MKPRRFLWWFSFALVSLTAASCSLLCAGEANPSPPRIAITASNAQPRLVFPYPAAEQYNVLSTRDAGQPTMADSSGILLGPTFSVTNFEASRLYGVAVTPLTSNQLLAATVLNRLTYGPTPDDLDRITTIGPQQFIDEQLAFEAVAEHLDADPPITNTPPVPPPLTNWIRVSATSTASGTNVTMYLSTRGRVYLDDIRLVLGTNADVGPNLVLNGDFEDPQLSPPWFPTATTAATVITNSPTPDGKAASGTRCLLLISSGTGGNTATSFWQPFATNLQYSSTQRFALSFSYLPVQNTSNTVLAIRAGYNTASYITLPPAPPTPPAPPAPVSPVYSRLTNGAPPVAIDTIPAVTNSISDLRAYHVLHAIQSKRQLYEILVQFFDNHFSTEYQKLKDWFDGYYSNVITNDSMRVNLAVDFEWREHKRWRQLLLDPNCTFYDLLKVSIESPAMIIYLDTILSSRTAANENYAREVLELHTMGADNGYLQADIVDLAKIWTGWSVAKKDVSNAENPFVPRVSNVTNDLGVFVLHFNTNSHNYTSTKRLFTNNVIDPRFGPFRGGQPYSLVINANQYPDTNGMTEGYKVIEHLTSLPYTMEFVSVKLCRLFVHENFEFGIYDYTVPNLSPEAQLVKECMTAWDTPAADGRKGNIRSVVRAILNSDLFRGHAASRQKVKTPLEFAVSAVRALRVTSLNAQGYAFATADSDGYGIGSGNSSPLSRMGGMALFNKVEPDGYSEFGRIWLNTANLCERMRFVEHLLMPTTSSLKTTDYGTPGLKNTSDPAALIHLRLPATDWDNPAAVVDYFLGLFFPGEGMGNLGLDRQAAIDFLTTNDAGQPAPFTLATNESRLRGMVAFLMCLPRFQEQ
jgi:uncharacterized protein (DUF1800 family)